MPHDISDPYDAHTWIRFAKSDLAYARMPLPPEGMFEQACFHAQQAAEKAIKAVLVHAGIEFPKTHSIGFLIELLPSHIPPAEVFVSAVDLTAYAVGTRYPGCVDTVDAEEYHEMLTIAEDVVAWADTVINGLK